jgi:hypothetical protein
MPAGCGAERNGPRLGNTGALPTALCTGGSIDSMDSGFTLTIDWLAFTVLASNPQETMKVLGGDWSKAKGGFRGYPLSWMRVDGLRGVGKLGTNAPRRPNEIHVDLSGGLASALTLDQIRTLLQWVHKQQGHVTRIDCALDDRASDRCRWRQSEKRYRQANV